MVKLDKKEIVMAQMIMVTKVTEDEEQRILINVNNIKTIQDYKDDDREASSFIDYFNGAGLYVKETKEDLAIKVNN
jgi:hypothetical protein